MKNSISKKFISVVLALVAVLAPLLTTVGFIATGLGGLTTAMGAVGISAGAIAVPFGTALVAVTALAEAIRILYGLFTNMDKELDRLAGKLDMVFNNKIISSIMGVLGGSGGVKSDGVIHGGSGGSGGSGGVNWDFEYDEINTPFQNTNVNDIYYSRKYDTFS